MDITIRPITPEELAAFIRTNMAAFGGYPSDADLAAFRAEFEYDRGLAVFEGPRLVATTGAYAFELTLPGLTTLPVAGVSWVGVLPTHRRRGLLRAMMARQLDDVAARGEALAILNAAESAIYGRFGYGLATSVLGFDLDPRRAAFARPVDPPGQLSLVDHERATVLIPAVYDHARRLQPGALDRNAVRWANTLRNPHAPHEGAGARFYVAYEPAPGQVDGVATYRIRERWDDGLPSSTAVLRELIATTPMAYAVLWQYILNLDLVTIVQARNRPVDEPLRWLLADPRRLRITGLSDDLWVRLLDVPAALSARRYSVNGRLVLDVSDPFRPATNGRYLLDGGPEGAECRPTGARPDLALDVADLGAAYLGGVTFGVLARAGRVVEYIPGALRRADLMFGCAPAPWCATAF